MRFLIACVVVAISMSLVQAQSKSSKRFSFPPQATPNDYLPGRVLVKIKEQFKTSFTASPAGRAPQLLLGGTMRSLAPRSVSANNTRARAAAFKPAVDMARYFEVRFDAAKPVEDFINELYASGYVELAEPVYRQHMYYEPNDPSLSSQWYLQKIRAIEAWDITQGSDDILIAIVDSGVDIDHPDLQDQLYTNEADPVNHIDDDNNGYVDDYRGWDFSGADTLNAFDPSFVGDNDPSIPKSGPGFTHGTQVGATAAASADNGIGMAGVAFRSKLLFTKHFADNQPSTDRSYSSNLYLGVLYAAAQGARVINCSWGSYFRSQVYQDVITHVTMDLGCLVISASGNDGIDALNYPAGYDYVLSVGATNENDLRAGFSNYGYGLDLVAPGVNIFTATYDNSYSSPDGTSFSGPITAGAAALVMTAHPEYSPLQVAEQLRVTADKSIYEKNASYRNKLGTGRLDVYNALTVSSPSVRALNYSLENEGGTTAEPGDEALLYFDFINYLESTSGGLEIGISTASPSVTITEGTIRPGAIASGATLRNTLTPFKLTLNGNIPENTSVDLLISYSDGAYQDFQVFSFIPNPSFRNIDDNQITTTLTSTGRIGFEDTQNSENGNGFIFNDQSILFEMGVIMGSSPTTVLNVVRNGIGGYDQDFVSTSQIREIVPGERSDAEVFGSFSNSATAAAQTVQVGYRSLVWRDAPHDQFVIIEYKVKNPRATAINDFHFGLFADWDISFSGGQDAALWNDDKNLGYVYPKQSEDLPQAGIQLLTGSANYFAIDNDANINENPFGIYDGFTDTEKFTSISSTRTEAGMSNANGNDVSHVVSAGPFDIAPGEEITIAFALHAASNHDALLQSAMEADRLYNYTLLAPRPAVDTVETCYNAPATLTATGSTQYKWYTEFTGGEPVATGAELVLPALQQDTTLYVSNAAAPFESVRTAAHVTVRARPVVVASRSTTLCAGESVTLSLEEGTSYSWSTGAIAQTIDVSAAGDYNAVITYNNGLLNCVTTTENVTVSVQPRPVAAFTADNGLFEDVPFQFTDASSDAVAWFWDFGDDGTSEEQSPAHTFANGGSYEVALTVTGANGCQDQSFSTVSVVTGLEQSLERYITVYPVPSRGQDITVQIDGVQSAYVVLELLNAQGASAGRASFGRIDRELFQYSLKTASVPPGVYYLKVQVEQGVSVKKVIVN